MTIYKYKNGWKVEIYINAKRVKSKSGFPNKSQAKKWHDTTLGAIANKPSILEPEKESG